MIRHPPLLRWRTFFFLATLLLIGCSKSNKEISPVSGTVTLDGTPLAHASITFQPKSGGRPSYGVTNDRGHYILEYSLNELGAKIGPCTVKITTQNRSDDGKLHSKEHVPKRYNKEAIEVEVKSKPNTIDIPLTSK